MTDRDKIEELIARLEKATRPDRELDIAIFRFVVVNSDLISDKEINGPTAAVPRYTNSIDSALSLVPEGFKWKCGYSRFVPHVAELRDYRDKPVLGTFIGECDSNRAIALCIAALRTRSISTKEKGE